MAPRVRLVQFSTKLSIKLKTFILNIIFSLAALSAISQDTLSGQYENLNLAGGSYLVKGVVSVNGTFTMAAGSVLFFDEGASLVCYKGVQLLGNASNRIKLQSLSGKKANGLVIRGNAPESVVQVEFAHFSQLMVPLRFEGEWYRLSVTIVQTEFVDNISPNSIVYVMPPLFEPGKENPLIKFLITQSVFSGNESPVYFEDLTSDNLHITISDNVFMSNRLADYGVYNFSGNIIFGRADIYSSTYQAVFSGNSFLQNYLLNLSADTVLRESSIGVFGTFGSLNATNNFWGFITTPFIRNNVYDYYTNYTAPKLIIEPFLLQPGSQAPPHVFKVLSASSQSQEEGKLNILLGSDFDLQKQVQSSFSLFANRPIRFSSANTYWFYLDDSLQVRSRRLNARFLSAPFDRQALLELDSISLSLVKKYPGYVEISGFLGENEEFVPSVTMGYRSFLRLKKQAIDLDRLERLRSVEPDRPKTSELPVPKEVLPGMGVVYPAFVPHQNIYFILSINSSSQTIDDVNAPGQFIYPVDMLTRSGFSFGGGGGIRWVNHYTKQLSFGSALSYNYIRPSQTFLNTDSLPPFTGRFVGFVPRKVFHFIGLSAFGSINYSDLRFTAGGTMEVNLSPFAPLDLEGFNSYRDLMWSLFGGIEYEFDPFSSKNNNKPPGYLLGLRYRRGFPMLTTNKVLNTTDLIEFYMAAEIKPFTKYLNKKKIRKK